MDKYKNPIWHDTSKELPAFSGARCMCYHTWFHQEIEMIFHKSRRDSGYKDFFTEVAYKGKAYDYDLIKYWAYYPEYCKEYNIESKYK